MELDNLNFLVDTGAVPSVLSEKAAARIGITGVDGSLALLHEQIQAAYITVLGRNRTRLLVISFELPVQTPCSGSTHIEQGKSRTRLFAFGALAMTEVNRFRKAKPTRISCLHIQKATQHRT